MKKTKYNLIKYIKHIDINIIFQTIFGLGAVFCAIGSCACGPTASSFFGMLKDIFQTAMVFVIFIFAIKHLKKVTAEKKDKLDYLDNWEEYKSAIYECQDISIFDKHILYGIQASTYTEKEIEKIYSRIEYAFNEKLYSNVETENILLCVQSILEVFKKTKRLTVDLNKEDFESIKEKLMKAYEEKITDPDLAAWCKILRNDKLELCLELYANTLHGEKKISVLHKALELCNKCIIMLEDQVLRNKNDKYFALFFRCYSTRNIAQIYKQLYMLELKTEYIQKEKEYRIKALNERKELYNYYRIHYKSNSVTQEYIEQEYILALAEEYQFVQDVNKKDQIKNEVFFKYNQWETQHEIKNSLFNKINKAVKKLPQ